MKRLIVFYHQLLTWLLVVTVAARLTQWRGSEKPHPTEG